MVVITEMQGQAEPYRDRLHDSYVSHLSPIGIVDMTFAVVRRVALSGAIVSIVGTRPPFSSYFAADLSAKRRLIFCRLHT